MPHDDNANFFATGSAAEDTDDADLQESVTALSLLVAGRLPLEELLAEVAAYAVHAIPNASGAGLTLTERARADTVVATDDFVREIEDIQYALGEGPCISATQQGQTVLVRSLGGDRRWPRFSGRVARLGVHSAIAIPLKTHDQVIGAINVYAHPKDAFTPGAAEIGERFAVPAAIAVQNAHILEQARRLAVKLEHALQTHGSINRAVGIIMSRTGATPEEALTRLRQLSQKEHRKLTAVATDFVDEAARNARARHTGG